MRVVFTKIEPFSFYLLLAIFIGLSGLNFFVGYADNGDFSRSVGFLFERPSGFSVMWPAAESEEWGRRFFAHWHDKWEFLSNWGGVRSLHTLSSYKIYLLLQVGFDAFFTGGDHYYSIIFGSIVSRVILLGAFFALVFKFRKTLPAFEFWAFFSVAAVILLGADWMALLNSFYEEQITIIFFPLLAFLLSKFYDDSRAAIAVLLLVLATFIASAKTAYFYFPTMMAFFLLPSMRVQLSWKKNFLLLVFVCQAASILPVFFGVYKNINSYHALYGGALQVMEKEEAAPIRSIGEKPVLHECIGVSAFSPGGQDCVDRAKASYADIGTLLLRHPVIGVKVVSELYAESKKLSLDYLGKSVNGAPEFSSVRAFRLPRVLFANGFVLLVLLSSSVSAFMLWRLEDGVDSVGSNLLKVGLFFALVGFSQYVVALGDGFFEITKHLIAGNYSLGLSFAFALPGICLVVRQRWRRFFLG